MKILSTMCFRLGFIGIVVLGVLFSFNTFAPSSAIGLQVPGSVLSETTTAYTYDSGSLVNDNGTIYYINGTVKIPFTNFEAFKGLGYSAKNVVKGNLSNYISAKSYFITTANQEHPWGSWLLYKGVVYYSNEAGLIPVPSWEIFLANGGKSSLIVNANKYDIGLIKPETKVNLLELNDSRVQLSGIIQPSFIAGNTPKTPTDPAVCSYPATPLGYHYEGQDYKNSCGKYLVLDSASKCNNDPSCENPPPVTDKVPSISAMSPLSGIVGAEVTVKGVNFTATGNTVNFGTGVVPDISSTNEGTQLKFIVPTGITAGCYYSTPKCLMLAQIVAPGNYTVSITNSNGTSNVLNFEVTEASCPGPILCAAPPEGYTYQGGGKCSCGTLTPIINGKICAVPVSCAAPPAGYNYQGGNSCECGQLVLGNSNINN